MKTHQTWIASLALASLTGFALAGPSLVLPVSEDESVYSGLPEKNYSQNNNRGGLFVGADGTEAGVARFYLKFALPALLKPELLESATLTAVYNDDLDRQDNGLHRIHFVAADDWSEKTITWANQPGTTFGTPEAMFNAASAQPGTTLRWDMTEITRSQLKQDDMLSLAFVATNESLDVNNHNWEYFAEREVDPSRSFHLTLATSSRVGGGTDPLPTAVPLPPAFIPAALTLGSALAYRYRSMRRLRAGQ